MRGLLAIEYLYHRIILGNKTQTRRSGGLEVVNENPDDWEKAAKAIYAPPGDGLAWQGFAKAGSGLIALLDPEVICKPRYKVGEVLYLKEPTCLITNAVTEKEYMLYKFDLMGDDDRLRLKWSNKLFMPEADARAFIRITGIRCERLMDISDQDAIAEGIERHDNGYWKDYNTAFNKLFAKPKDSFISLYVHANKMKRTDPIKNIWVWVYEFEYLKNYQP